MYNFYLDDILLPVTPSELSINIGDKNEVIELLNDRDLIIPRTPSLKEISFTALFPASKVPYAVYLNNVFESPSEFITKIQKLKYDKKKFLFSVTRNIGNTKYFDTSIQVVLSDFDYYEGVDEGFDIKVSIKLKEYKEASTQVGKITQDEKGNPIIHYEKVVEDSNSYSNSPLRIGNIDVEKIDSVYTVKNESDTLWKIAKKIFDDGSKYKDLKIFETLQDWSEYENNGPNYLKVNQDILLLDKVLSKGG